MKSKLAMDALRHTVTGMPNDRLTPARLAALAQIDEQGLPTTKHEDWKYTDIGKLVETSNQWLAAGSNGSPVSDDVIESITTQFDAAWLVIRNGVVDTETIDNLALSHVDVKLLTDTDTNPGYEAPMSDLNLALLRDGLTIHVNAGADKNRTIGMLFIDSAIDEVGVSPTRINIDLDENSSANFIEYHASMGQQNHYANSVVDMTPGTGRRWNEG